MGAPLAPDGRDMKAGPAESQLAAPLTGAALAAD